MDNLIYTLWKRHEDWNGDLIEVIPLQTYDPDYIYETLTELDKLRADCDDCLIYTLEVERVED